MVMTSNNEKFQIPKQHRLVECDQSLLAKWNLELRNDPKISPRMFLPKLLFVEQKIHQMSFNLKRKANF